MKENYDNDNVDGWCRYTKWALSKGKNAIQELSSYLTHGTPKAIHVVNLYDAWNKWQKSNEYHMIWYDLFIYVSVCGSNNELRVCAHVCDCCIACLM